GFAIIFPLIYKLFDKNPILGLLSCYIIEFCFQIIADFIPYGGLHYLFDGCIIRFLSAIGLGVWFIYGHDIFAKRNLFVILLFPLSLFLSLISHNALIGGIFPPSFFDNLSFIFERAPYSPAPYNYGLRFFRLYPYWININLFVFFYPALLFLIFMKVLPSKLNENKKISQKTQKTVRFLSKLTYHILLVQIVYFFVQIPLSTTDWDFLLINREIFSALLDPINAGVPMSMLSTERYFGLFIAKCFFYFISVVIVISLSICFYLVESGFRKGFKKTGQFFNKKNHKL
ncbi:MAG: hypothetical protein KGD63_13360, partial [Candidatus Lokiarchaeota archaeon]|nr:hypothetical protein [Candidatus Lokiarchaeota archaeon]